MALMNLKAGLHGTICRPDVVGAQILRVFWQPMDDRFMEMAIGPIQNICGSAERNRHVSQRVGHSYCNVNAWRHDKCFCFRILYVLLALTVHKTYLLTKSTRN